MPHLAIPHQVINHMSQQATFHTSHLPGPYSITHAERPAIINNLLQTIQDTGPYAISHTSHLVIPRRSHRPGTHDYSPNNIYHTSHLVIPNAS